MSACVSVLVSFASAQAPLLLRYGTIAYRLIREGICPDPDPDRMGEWVNGGRTGYKPGRGELEPSTNPQVPQVAEKDPCTCRYGTVMVIQSDLCTEGEEEVVTRDS